MSDIPGRPTPIINALSIDVEDWFQVSAFAPHIDRQRWSALPCRIERNVDLLLGALARNAAHATFFTLGWVAERHPSVVRAIVAAGHELASHGYDHRRVTEFDAQAFRADLVRARRVLEDVSGVAIRGYRAPSFSVGAASPWAHEVILQTGHRYSSSVFPVAHDHYGDPHAPRFAHRLHNGLWELPPSTIRLRGRNFPIAGGGWFRLLPYATFAWGLHRLNRLEAQPALTYFHPWEFDPEQPRPPRLGMRTRLRHYLNLNRTQARLERLLGEFRWNRLDVVFAEQLARSPLASSPNRESARGTAGCQP